MNSSNGINKWYKDKDSFLSNFTHKAVNIAINYYSGRYLFSLLIENQATIEMIKHLIKDNYIKKNKRIDTDNMYLKMIYEKNKNSNYSENLIQSLLFQKEYLL